MYDKIEIFTDQLLIERVLRGDTEAFKLIVKNTEGLVTQIIFKMIPNSEDRKDIAQDVYLKSFQNLSGFRFRSKLSTWVGQITYNTCINYLEKKKLVSLDTSYDYDKPDSEELEILNYKTRQFINENEDPIFKKERSEILKSEMDKLSPVFKTLITLYHNEELSYSEISEITRLPEGTVKSYLFRARKTLKDSLLRTYKKEEL